MKRYYHPSYSSFFITENGDIYNAGGTGKKLKGSIVNGYKRISIRPKGENPISIPAHVFIWEAFNKEETDNYFKIIHIDSDKQNNRPNNLKRVINDSSNPVRKERKITATNLTTEKEEEYGSIYSTSKSLKINSGLIKLIADGKRKTATSKLNNNKFTFKYSNPNDLNIVKIIKEKIKSNIEKGNLKI